NLRRWTTLSENYDRSRRHGGNVSMRRRSLSRRRGYAQVQSHAHQLRERAGACLFHYARAVEFDRPLTQEELAGHGLVGAALHHQPEYVLLARGQRLEPP